MSRVATAAPEPSVYRVSAPGAGPNGIYWAGQVFHVAPRDVPAAHLTPEQRADLVKRPDLTVETR